MIEISGVISMLLYVKSVSNKACTSVKVSFYWELLTSNSTVVVEIACIAIHVSYFDNDAPYCIPFASYISDMGVPGLYSAKK